MAFQGRSALVAGAASGIGAAVARRLASLGAQVFCADLDADGAREVARQLEGSVALALDATDEPSWEAAVSAVAASGRLDVLVNCVGITAGSPLVETSLAEWRRVLATNLDGAFLGTKHAIRAMGPGGGSIVHVGSASGIRAAAGAAAYSTSKAALKMLVSVAAKECRAAGLPIRINVVSPAGVKTPLWRSMASFRDLVRTTGSEEAAFDAMEKGGGGPFSSAEDVARVVCFVASDDARHVNGVDLPADDGYVL